MLDKVQQRDEAARALVERLPNQVAKPMRAHLPRIDEVEDLLQHARP